MSSSKKDTPLTQKPRPLSPLPPTAASPPTSPSFPTASIVTSSPPASSASSPPNSPARPLQPPTTQEWWLTPSHILLPADAGFVPYPPHPRSVATASGPATPAPPPSRPLPPLPTQMVGNASGGAPAKAIPQEGEATPGKSSGIDRPLAADVVPTEARPAVAAAVQGSSGPGQLQAPQPQPQRPRPRPPTREERIARQTREITRGCGTKTGETLGSDEKEEEERARRGSGLSRDGVKSNTQPADGRGGEPRAQPSSSFPTEGNERWNGR